MSRKRFFQIKGLPVTRFHIALVIGMCSVSMSTAMPAMAQPALSPMLASAAQVVSRKVLGELPANYVKDTLVVSDDGQQIAYVVKTDDGQRVVLNGKEGVAFKQVAGLVLSPMTNRLFYWALEGISNSQRVVLVADGKTLPMALQAQGSLWFSSDGNHWATMVTPAADSGKTSGTVVAILDGKEMGRYPNAGYPSFNRDGKHLAYIVQDGNSKISLMIDGKVRQTYEQPSGNCSFIFQSAQTGPDLGGQFAARYLSDDTLLLLVRDKNCWTVSKNGRALASYSHNIWGGGSLSRINFSGYEDLAAIPRVSLSTASASPAVAWWERLTGKDDRWRVMRDGKPADKQVCDDFWDSQPPVLSPDGLRLAYPCITQTKITETVKISVSIVVDGQKLGTYENVWGLRFSEDGRHVAYAALTGGDDKAQPEWSYFVDAKLAGPKYDSVYPPEFSEDGEHLAWTAIRDEKEVLAVDGRDMAVVDEVVAGPRIQSSGHATWIVRDGNQIIQMEFGG